MKVSNRFYIVNSYCGSDQLVFKKDDAGGIKMYQLTKEELARLGAEITTREIHQQPKLWQETLENYEKAYERVTLFLASVKKNTTSRV